jgi:glutaminyl-peptide cyclotransferase
MRCLFGRSLRLPVLLVAASIWAGALLAGCGNDEPAQQSASSPGFDAARAWRLIERQVDFGQRPAGSPALRRLAAQLRPLLPDGRFEPVPGEPALRNIVGTLPGAEPAIVVGAHYDTLRKPRGFVGANNGAAGTAIVLEVAEALSRRPSQPGDREVRFVLFDGEEPAVGKPEEAADFYSEGLRGSRAYVAAHPGETEAMILLDYVANQGLLLPREASSDPELWDRILQAASVVGAGRFFTAETGPEILDDHTPFLRAGVPAVDLIDWRYPGHSLADGLDKLSLESVDGVGRTVVQAVTEMRTQG